MLSKSQIRFVSSLQNKKFRMQHQAFIVEGWKSIEEFLHSSYQVKQIYFTAAMDAKMGKIPENIKLYEVSEDDLRKISALKTPQGVVAVLNLPEQNAERHFKSPESFRNKFTLVLDGVQDPGNLGTILRTADWFGIDQILCSPDCADVYNPKTVQASMGSLSRLPVYYTPLLEILDQLGKTVSVPIYGAVLDGQPIGDINFGKDGIIILGNEGQGIRPEIQNQIQVPVTIPRKGGGESLNVAISAALFCARVSGV